MRPSKTFSTTKFFTPRRCRREGFTLIEAMIAVGLSSLLFAAVSSQLLESSKLSLRITQTLEHSRNARVVIDTLSADIRAAQILQIYPDFTNRATEARDGETGNYLVMHFVDVGGTITRTVGYYVVPLAGPHGWALYRHDSATSDSVAGSLPDAASPGRHRAINRALRLPNSTPLFRCMRDRGVSLQGEFGTTDTFSATRFELLQCTISTRS